jgi:energy-coupling factor transport system permease protein
MSDVVTVSPQETRVEPVKASSPSWFIARINAVSRIIGALLLCIPMFISLDAVSASTALGIEFVLLWIGGVAPWTVCRKTWPVWIAAAGSFISVFLYGRTSGEILWQGGWIVISEGSINLAIATAIRVAAIAVPGVILALGLDPTDLADGLVEILHFSPRFVYGGLAACLRCCRKIGAHSACPSVRAALVTVTPSPVPSPKRSDCWCSPSGVPPNLPPPWKRAASAPAPHVPKPASRV